MNLNVRLVWKTVGVVKESLCTDSPLPFLLPRDTETAVRWFTLLLLFFCNAVSIHFVMAHLVTQKAPNNIQRQGAERFSQC